MTNAVIDQNFTRALIGVSSADGKTILPVEIDPVTGGIIVNSSVTVGTVSFTNANCYTGQTTVNTTQVQVTIGSHALTNGMVIKSLSTNSASIYVGLTGITTSTGDILEPGEARGYAVNNTNLLYIISVASTTDKVSWSAN